MLNKKPLIIGFGISMAVLIAVLVTLNLTVWAQPTKKDFTDAKSAAETISAQSGSALFKEFAAAVSAARKEGKSYDQIVEASKDEKTALINALNIRSENAAVLANSKVLQDEDVKKSHAVYAAEEQKYDAFFRSYADAYPAYISSFTSCEKIYDVTKQTQDVKAVAGLHKTASEDCLKELKILADGSFKPFSDYAKTYSRIIGDRQKAFDGFSAGTLPSDEASAKLQALGAESAKLDPIPALTKLQDDSLLNGELTALMNLLGTKANQAQ